MYFYIKIQYVIHVCVSRVTTLVVSEVKSSWLPEITFHTHCRHARSVHHSAGKEVKNSLSQKHKIRWMIILQ